MEASHERTTHARAASGVVLPQPVDQAKERKPLNHRQLPRRLAHVGPVRRRAHQAQAVRIGRRRISIETLCWPSWTSFKKKRKNTIQTRNARLTAIRSFFHHVAANDPASLGIAQRILAIPIKKTEHRSDASSVPSTRLTLSLTRRTSKLRAAGAIGRCCFSWRAPARAFLRLSASMPATSNSIVRDHRCSCAAKVARSGSCRSRAIS